MSKTGLSKRIRILAIVLSISAPVMARGMCEVGKSLNTMMLAGRQLLKLPDFPIHARMLVSPELVSSWAKSRPSALSPSPYTTGNERENIPSNEYTASSTRVVYRVETRRSFSRVASNPGRSAIKAGAETPSEIISGDSL